MVDRRNQIQTLMLQLLLITGLPTSPEWQLMVGAAFSLWRAVFIANTGDMDQAGDLDEYAQRYLRTVVETNTITFTDDRNLRVWSGGYYINNALFRPGLRTATPVGTRKVGERLSSLWDEAFRELENRVATASRVEP